MTGMVSPKYQQDLSRIIILKKMKYYRVTKSAEPSVIGVTHGLTQGQVDEMGFKNKRYYEKFAAIFGNIQRYDLKEALEVDDLVLECVKLERKAIVTDFL
jgi:hypothetical protein